MAGSATGRRPWPRARPTADADPLPGMVSGLSRQNSVYRRMMAVCDKLAGAAVQGADAAELTRIFAETAGKTVILLDPDLRPQAQAAAASRRIDRATGIRATPASRSCSACWPPSAGRFGCRPCQARRSPYGCLATPVIVGDAILGYLLVLDETAASADDVDLIVTSYAATLFALTLARTQTSLELGLRYRGAIVDSLVSGHFLDSHDARRKARILGVADAQPFRVAVARVSAPATFPAAAVSTSRISPRNCSPALAGSLQCAAAIRGPELVMLLPEQDGTATTAGPRRRTAAFPEPRHSAAAAPQAGAARLTCGLSELTRLPEMAPQALRQAQHAIDLGIRLGRAGQTISYEELGIYRLLLQIGDMHQLWQFAEDVLGPADRLRRPAQGGPRRHPVRLPEPAREPQADRPGSPRPRQHGHLPGPAHRTADLPGPG